MEGPKIPGPSIWLDSVRISESRTLDFLGHLNDRFRWLDEFTEECKRKLGVDSTKEPTFAPKTPGKKKKKGTAARKSSPVTLNATKTRGSRRTKNDASILETNPVPKPRASKRTRQIASSASSQSSESSEEKDEPTVKKSPDVIEASANISETHAEEILTEVVNSTVIVSNDIADKTFEVNEVNPVEVAEENVFIEADVVNKPNAVDAVRSLLASAENSFSPIAAPRRSFRNLEQEASENETIKKTPKKSLIDEPNSKPSSVSSEDSAADETLTHEIPKKSKSHSRSRGSQSSTSSVAKSSCSEAEVEEAVTEEMAVIDAPATADDDTKASSEVAEVLETVKSAEKTVIVTKEVEEVDSDNTAANVRRSTRSKVQNDQVEEPRSSTKTKDPVVEPEPEQEESRRLTRTKAAEEADVEAGEPRRSTRTKVVNKDDATKEKRVTRTKANDVEATSGSEDDQTAKRVTRSKATKPKQQEETRSTRTFSKTASSASLTKSAASPRVRELAARALSPSKTMTPPRSQVNVGYTGSPIRDRVKVFENAMKESAGLKSSDEDTDHVPAPKTPSAKYFTPKRKSSIANSLRKVSAARKMTVTQVVEEQDVNVVSPPRKGPVIRKSPGNKAKANLNNSRAPAGKVVKPGKKVAPSPVTGPKSGGHTGSNSTNKSKSRMDIIERAGRTTPLNNGRTTPNGNGPVNLRTGLSSFLPQKPKGPTLEEMQEKKEEERKQKEQRELEARQRREEQLKSKAEEAKRVREERIRKVKEAREAQENQKENQMAKKIEENEKREKLAVLRKKQEMHKEAEKKRKEAERKEAEERQQKEEEERMLKVEAEKKAEKQRQEEEKMKERMRQEKIKKEEERKKLEEKRQANIAEKERIAREQEELRKLKEREAARPQPDLDSTYNKPGDATFNKTLDRTNNPSSYDITPARHELPTPPPQTEDNYGVADLRSDSDTDDEDNPKKQVPKWAEGTQLRTALLKQCYMGPDVDKIFYPIEDPDLSVMFNQQKKRYFKRTSSACWDSAPQSFNFKRV